MVRDLKARRIWVCFIIENGKKKPISASGTATGPDILHSNTWVTYEEAVAAMNEHGYNAVGFVVPAGMFFLDIDHRVPDDQCARQMLLRFHNTYAEYSYSGNGIHIYGICDADQIPTITEDGKTILDTRFYQKNPDTDIELYFGSLTSRFAIFTGRVINDYPFGDCTDAVLQTLEQDMQKMPLQLCMKPSVPNKIHDQSIADLIDSLRNQRNGEKFSRLFDAGDCSGYNSHSEADCALCALIAFRTGPRPELIDQIFRMSALMRGKWNRADYRTSTITLAINTCGNNFVEKKEELRGNNQSTNADDTNTKTSTQDASNNETEGSNSDNNNSIQHPENVEAETPNKSEYWHYTKDDFLHGTAPYEEIFALEGQSFLQKQQIEAMSAYAKSVGVTTFKSFYKEYSKEQMMLNAKQKSENITMFTGQPLALACASWVANDDGVYNGTTVACSHPIMPVERLVNLDTGKYRTRIAFRRGGQWGSIIAENSMLASKHAILSLADYGISVTSETAGPLVRYLAEVTDQNYDVIPMKMSVSRLGYINGKGFVPYIDEVVFDGEDRFKDLIQAVSSKGSYDEWLQIARECRQMSTTARIVLAASFASPLLSILGVLPYFVHLWGVESGTGKTVALMLAASVWGNPEIGAYIRTFDSTAVGHEKTVSFLNHLPFCIDELQLIKDDKGQSSFNVYRLTEGAGKSRSNRAGGVDKSTNWKNCILTTGESPIYSPNDGAGKINRVIDIECKSKNAVIVDGTRISNGLRNNFGWAGRTFVEKIYSPGAKEGIVQLYDQLCQSLSKGRSAGKQEIAAATILTADHIATELFFKDDLQLKEDDIKTYLASKQTVSAGERGYQYLCEWVVRNLNRFVKNENTFTSGDIYGKLEDNMALIIRSVFNTAMQEGHFSERAVLSWLKENNKIKFRGKNNTLGRTIKGQRLECIALYLPEVDIEDEEENLPF